MMDIEFIFSCYKTICPHLYMEAAVGGRVCDGWWLPTRAQYTVKQYNSAYISIDVSCDPRALRAQLRFVICTEGGYLYLQLKIDKLCNIIVSSPVHPHISAANEIVQYFRYCLTKDSAISRPLLE